MVHTDAQSRDLGMTPSVMVSIHNSSCVVMLSAVPNGCTVCSDTYRLIWDLQVQWPSQTHPLRLCSMSSIAAL